MSDEYLLKICILGSPDEIKTQMARMFAEGKFTPDYSPTLGVDITTKRIQVDGNTIKLIIVDLTSDVWFEKERRSYYRGSSAAIITFDKGDRNSFKEVIDFYTEVKNHFKPNKKAILQIMLRHPRLFTEEEVEEYKSRAVVIPIALVGFITNSEEITTVEGQDLADKLDVPYYETQTSNKNTIERIFHDLTRKVLGKGS